LTKWSIKYFLMKWSLQHFTFSCMVFDKEIFHKVSNNPLLKESPIKIVIFYSSLSQEIQILKLKRTVKSLFRSCIHWQIKKLFLIKNYLTLLERLYKERVKSIVIVL
jgi:hypothetical protein